MSVPPSDPQALRAEIARTRADLGETIEALAAKTRLTARARTALGRRVPALARRPSVRTPLSWGAIAAGVLLIAAVAYAARHRRA